MDPTYGLAEQIVAVVDALDDATNRFAEVSRVAAIAEADFKGAHARAIVKMSDSALHGKMTANQRDANAMVQCRDEHREYLIRQAESDATRQALYSLRARLDALRTLNANSRILTDPRTPS